MKQRVEEMEMEVVGRAPSSPLSDVEMGLPFPDSPLPQVAGGRKRKSRGGEQGQTKSSWEKGAGKKAPEKKKRRKEKERQEERSRASERRKDGEWAWNDPHLKAGIKVKESCSGSL